MVKFGVTDSPWGSKLGTRIHLEQGLKKTLSKSIGVGFEKVRIRIRVDEIRRPPYLSVRPIRLSTSVVNFC